MLKMLSILSLGRILPYAYKKKGVVKYALRRIFLVIAKNIKPNLILDILNYILTKKKRVLCVLQIYKVSDHIITQIFYYEIIKRELRKTSAVLFTITIQ